MNCLLSRINLHLRCSCGSCGLRLGLVRFAVRVGAVRGCGLNDCLTCKCAEWIVRIVNWETVFVSLISDWNSKTPKTNTHTIDNYNIMLVEYTRQYL